MAWFHTTMYGYGTQSTLLLTCKTSKSHSLILETSIFNNWHELNEMVYRKHVLKNNVKFADYNLEKFCSWP